MMQTVDGVETLTLRVMKDFMMAGVLFTALDVSIKVRETIPGTPHREVRDIVRNQFLRNIVRTQFPGMEAFVDYDKTIIDVYLANGDTVKAWLYHPCDVNYDELDHLYDVQQRTQTLVDSVPDMPSYTTPVQQPQELVVPTITVEPQVLQVVVVNNPPSPPITAKNKTELWDALFAGASVLK